MQYAMALASEKGTSGWLLALPLKEHGSTFQSQIFEMLFAFDTGGSFLVRQQIVFADSSLTQTIC